MKGETSAVEIWGKGHRRRERSSDSGSFCLRDKKEAMGLDTVNEGWAAARNGTRKVARRLYFCHKIFQYLKLP